MLRGLERIGKAVRSAPKDAMISAYSEYNKSGRTFGFHKMLDIAGELGGALCIFLILAWFTLDKDSIRVIFAATLIPRLTATAISMFLVEDVVPAETTKNKAVFHAQDLRLLPLIVLYFSAMLFIMSDQFMIIQAKEAGYAIAIIPLFIMLLTLTSYAGGIISDKIGNSIMLLIAFVSGILSIVALWKQFIWLSFIFLELFTFISLNAIRAYISQNARSKAWIGFYNEERKHQTLVTTPSLMYDNLSRQLVA